MPIHHQLPDLFEQAVGLAPEAREIFLLSACGNDSALLEELRELLAADEAAGQADSWNRSALSNEAAVESQSEDPGIGETIGAYRLVELIGKGGMGKVYRAVRNDAEFEISVAVKRIKLGLDAQHIIARFRSERQILAGLDHPNIARLLDGGVAADGLPYLIMEYVEGISPPEYCERNKFTVRQRLALFRQICSPVHYAHQRMVIHRDLKPGNILIASDGTPKLLDFGIAKVLSLDLPDSGGAATETALHMMTARYSSPEQIRGDPLTMASDVYSLGVILYELLTGHSPYRDVTRPPHELMTAVCNEAPQKPSLWLRELHGDLDNIILKALRKDPAARYSSVDQFSEDILRYLEHRPVEARGDKFLYVAAKLVRRNRVVTAAAVIVLCTLVVGLIAVSRARGRAEQRFNDVRRLAHSVMFDYSDAIDRLPGSTPVRARIVKDALSYLDGLSKEADTPELQREIVEAYVRVSAVQGDSYQNNLGDADAALDSVRKGAAAAEKLLREDGSPEAMAAAAGAFAVEASLLYSAGDLKAADRQFHRTVELRESVARVRPDDIENSMALSAALRRLGELYGSSGAQSMGKTSESVDFFRRAGDATAKLSAKFPGDVRVARERYETLLSLSQSESSLGHRDAALTNLLEASAQIQKVVASSSNDVNPRVELANVEVQLGQTLLEARRANDALPHMARSAGILAQLTAADPANAMLRRSQGIVENQWAAALRLAGDTKSAVQHNRRSLEIAETLSRGAPDSLEFRADVGAGQRKLSDTLLAAGDAKAALDHAAQGRKILCQAAQSSKDAYLEANCGRALVAMGNALLRLNSSSAAVDAYRKAEEIAAQRSRADAVNAIFRSDLARAQTGLGSGLARVGEYREAGEMYRAALKNFSLLRDARSLSAEDSHRAEGTAQGLAGIQPFLRP